MSATVAGVEMRGCAALNIDVPAVAQSSGESMSGPLNRAAIRLDLQAANSPKNRHLNGREALS